MRSLDYSCIIGIILFLSISYAFATEAEYSLRESQSRLSGIESSVVSNIAEVEREKLIKPKFVRRAEGDWTVDEEDRLVRLRDEGKPWAVI